MHFMKHALVAILLVLDSIGALAQKNNLFADVGLNKFLQVSRYDIAKQVRANSTWTDAMVAFSVGFKF